MPVPKKLPLGQFAIGTEPYLLIEGGFAVLSKLELPRHDRSRVKTLERQYSSILKMYKDDPINLQAATENLWLEVEDVMESRLMDYAAIDGNKIVPSWGDIDNSRKRTDGIDAAPWIASHRNQSKHAPQFVLEVRAEDVTLYEKVRAGRGHWWRKVWSVPANEAPVQMQIKEPMNPNDPHMSTD